MKSIINLLNFLNENWAMLATIITLVLALCFKIKNTVVKWEQMSKEEQQKEIDAQIAKAKQAIANYILSLVASAEIDWEGSGLGPIKRAQVIEKIYKEYPILLEVVDQRSLMVFIDDHINQALEIVREKLRKEAGTV